MVVVEVRQGTLGVDGRGWGPAGNTVRRGSWLRSDREHCASRVAVEQEDEEDEEDEEEEEKEEDEDEEEDEEEATDIKSNNPHLAGGEKNMFFLPHENSDLYNRRVQVEPDKSCDLCNAARMCILSAIQHTWKSSQLEIMHAGHDTQLLQGCCVAEFVFFPQGVVFNDNLRSCFFIPACNRGEWPKRWTTIYCYL